VQTKTAERLQKIQMGKCPRNFENDVVTDSQYKGAYTVFFKEKINLVMRNSNNRF
jgi:hypothetical protein